MLQHLYPYIPEHAGYSLPSHQKFLRSIQITLSKHKRYSERSMGYESPGISKLKQILNSVDYTWMRSKSLTDIYLNYLRHEKTSLDTIYSAVSTGQNFTRLFTSGRAAEYLIPVDDYNTLTRLPLDSGWLYWQFLKPLQIHWIDTLELTYSVLNSKIQFYKTPPTYAVYSLDPIALILKYHLWRTEGITYESRPEDTLTPQYFLHRHVVVPLLSTLTNCWLLNAMNTALSHQLDDEIVTNMMSNSIINTQYTYDGIMLAEGMKSLVSTLAGIKKNTHPRYLLNSPLFLYRGTLRDQVYSYLQDTPVARLIQYEYLTIMRDIDLYILIINLFALNKSLPIYRTMMLEQKRQWKRTLNRKPWDKCRNRNISATIELKYLQMMQLWE